MKKHVFLMFLMTISMMASSQFVSGGVHLSNKNKGKSTQFVGSTAMNLNKSKSSSQLKGSTNNANSTRGNNSATEPGDFSYIGVEYTSSFELPDMGSYSLCWQIFGMSGWGVEWGMGFNYGLIPSDYAGVQYRLGVVYGLVISDFAMLSTSFGFDGNYHGTGSYVSLEQTSSGNYYYITRSGDPKFDWGLSIKPQLVFKMGGMLLHGGLSINWSEVTSKVNVGFVVGIGF